MEHLIDSISTLLSCLLCYYIGKYKAHSDIYEKVLNEHVRRNFKKEFQDDIKNKLKKGQKKWKSKFNAKDTVRIPDGCKAIIKDGVVIFEKEERKEQEFKDGDVLHSEYSSTILIFKEMCEGNSRWFYSHYNTDCSSNKGWNKVAFRLATEEEKQQLFAEMKEQGLKWNAEEKRVEKIRWRAKLDEDYYYFSRGGLVVTGTEYQDNYSEDVWEFGNHFRTEEQAKKAAEAVRETLRQYHEEIGE